MALAAAVSTGHTAALDQSIRLAVYAHSSPALTAAFRFLTLFGETGVLLGLSVAATAVLAALRWKQAALWFAVSMLGAYALDMALKNSFHRPRPPVSFFATPMPNSFSFPSGHALFSLCFYGGLAIVVARAVLPAVMRTGLWIATVLLVLAIGGTRIYLGVHYPSDVLAGYLVAIAWIAIVLFAEQRMGS